MYLADMTLTLHRSPKYFAVTSDYFTILHKPSQDFIELYDTLWTFRVLHRPSGYFIELHDTSWTFGVLHRPSGYFVELRDTLWTFRVLHRPSGYALSKFHSGCISSMPSPSNKKEQGVPYLNYVQHNCADHNYQI
jgi:hypothetical protein